jgi:exodeoxyribonuclease V
MTFTPDAGQQAAIDAIEQWYHDFRGQQVYRLFGYAGSGKTTLARHIADLLGVDVLYATYTGKAADVLRRKGCAGAMTIHKLIYKPVSKSRTELQDAEGRLDAALDAWDQRLAEVIRGEIAELEQELASPHFVLNQGSQLRNAGLLILDEVSMVPEQIAMDLESFGVKILCLGDPAQLPPIKGAGHYSGMDPDTMLTTIHRSALESPVTRLATLARTEGPRGVAGMVGDSGRMKAPISFTEFDQVLVGTNKTRWGLITKMRKLAGHAGKVPQEGERILVLSNNADLNVFNGQQFTVRACSERGIYYDLALRDGDGEMRDLKVYVSGFEDADGEDKAKQHGWRGPIAAATFAHAITVHKAQGSQWDSVLVIDESGVFRKDASKWFYTAITRAAQRVVIRPRPVL